MTWRAAQFWRWGGRPVRYGSASSRGGGLASSRCVLWIPEGGRAALASGLVLTYRGGAVVELPGGREP